MTRPKADSDPWLTDMVSRDREIAKTVVYGMRTIISLLREIRDETAANQAHMQGEIRDLRQQVIDLWQAQAAHGPLPPVRGQQFEACENSYCSLPFGHPGNHRGSLRAS